MSRFAAPVTTKGMCIEGVGLYLPSPTFGSGAVTRMNWNRPSLQKSRLRQVDREIERARRRPPRPGAQRIGNSPEERDLLRWVADYRGSNRFVCKLRYDLENNPGWRPKVKQANVLRQIRAEEEAQRGGVEAGPRVVVAEVPGTTVPLTREERAIVAYVREYDGQTPVVLAMKAKAGSPGWRPRPTDVAWVRSHVPSVLEAETVVVLEHPSAVTAQPEVAA